MLRLEDTDEPTINFFLIAKSIGVDYSREVKPALQEDREFLLSVLERLEAIKWRLIDDIYQAALLPGARKYNRVAVQQLVEMINSREVLGPEFVRNSKGKSSFNDEDNVRKKQRGELEKRRKALVDDSRTKKRIA